MSPTTPASLPQIELLHKYQVEHRENGYLLKRMRDLEAKQFICEAQTSKAQEASATYAEVTQRIHDLERQVVACENNSQDAAKIQAMRKELTRHEKTIGTFKDIETRVDLLATNYHDLEEDVKVLENVVNSNKKMIKQLNDDIAELQSHSVQSKHDHEAIAGLQRRTHTLEMQDHSHVAHAQKVLSEIARLNEEVAKVKSKKKGERPRSPVEPVIEVPRSPVAEPRAPLAFLEPSTHAAGQKNRTVLRSLSTEQRQGPPIHQVREASPSLTEATTEISDQEIHAPSSKDASKKAQAARKARMKPAVSRKRWKVVKPPVAPLTAQARPVEPTNSKDFQEGNDLHTFSRQLLAEPKQAAQRAVRLFAESNNQDSQADEVSAIQLNYHTRRGPRQYPLFELNRDGKSFRTQPKPRDMATDPNASCATDVKPKSLPRKPRRMPPTVE